MTSIDHTNNREALERTAAEWFFRRDAGLSAAEEATLQAWLAEAPEHAEAFAEIEATWDQSLLVKDRVLGPVDIPAIQSVPERRNSRRLVWLPAAVGLAAAIAVGFFGWWQPAHYSGEMVTAVGEIRQWQLPDGSTIDLNTDTTVAVSYSFGERRIDLVKGEAHFAVAKNPERPFTVDAGTVSVRAVGTAFNVRRRSEAVDVLVTEGKVKVAAPDLDASPAGASLASTQTRDLYLDAGKKVSVALVVKAELQPQPAIETISQPVIAQTLAWQKRKVEFADATLGEMVEEFNRYNKHRLVIEDAELASKRFGGTFPADDYESFIQVLESTFGVSAERRSGRTVLHLKP